MALFDGIDMARVQRIADTLKARRETLAVSESSAGGLISAALLSVPGASAYFIGGGVIYTGTARETLLGVTAEQFKGIRSATEAAAALQAAVARDRLGTVWGLAETGATGPSGNRYGDAAGHCCVAVAGPRNTSRTIETASADRVANMAAFTDAALALLEAVLSEA